MKLHLRQKNKVDPRMTNEPTVLEALQEWADFVNSRSETGEGGLTLLYYHTSYHHHPLSICVFPH